LIVFVDLNKGREAIWIINPVSRIEKRGFVVLVVSSQATPKIVQFVNKAPYYARGGKGTKAIDNDEK
jgi:hypothetical protein